MQLEAFASNLALGNAKQTPLSSVRHGTWHAYAYLGCQHRNYMYIKLFVTVHVADRFFFL